MATIAKLVVALRLDNKDFTKGLLDSVKAQEDFEKKSKRTAEAAKKAIPPKLGDGLDKATQSFQRFGDAAATITNPLIGAYTAVKTSIGGIIQNIGSIPGPLSKAKAAFASVATSLKTSFSNSTVGQFISTLGKDIAAGLARLAPIAQGALKGLGSVIASIGPMLAGAAAGIGAAAVGIVGAFGAITAGAFSLAQAAAPAEGIRSAFAGITASIEGGATAMLASLQEASAGMVTNVELMRTFNQAAQLVSVDFAQKLPAAMEYLSKVSMATGQDMGFLLQSLTTGIGRLSAPILDNLAIQVDLTQAYQDFADKNGLVADSLTKSQQQAALMDQVLTKLQQNTANMPAVFGSAQQIFQAFRVDLLNIKDAVGADLLPTFTSLFVTFRQFMPAIQAFGQGFAGTFSAIVDVGKNFVKGLLSSMGVDFNALAGQSGSWGSNIVLQFASGMASAIGAVISVLNQLGQAIASWLAPGSPPRLLPDIDTWGTSAAQEFLNGMTAANVGVLRDLSGQVESFLRSTMSGQDSTAIAQAVLNARAALEDALSGGGDLMAALPQEVQGYAQALLQAQAAADAVSTAQDELTNLTRQYDDALSPISDRLSAIQSERDAFMRDQRRSELQDIIATSDDSDAVRFAQLELEEMALQEQQAAIEEERDVAIGAAEDKLAAAQAEQDMAEERLRLEQELLQHQIETNNLMADTIANLDAMATAGAGLSSAGVGAGAGLSSAGVGASKLSEALTNIGNVVPQVAPAISELAQQIMDQFAPISEQAKGLGETWGGVFTGMVTKGQELVTWWQTNFGEGGMWPSIIDMATGIFTSQWGEGGTWDGIFNNAKTAVGLLTDKWQQHWGAGGTWDSIIKMASSTLQTQWGAGGTWDGIFKNAKTAVGLLTDKWQQQWGEGGTWDGIIKMASSTITSQWGQGGTWDGIFNNAKTAVDLLTDKWKEHWGEGGTWAGIIDLATTLLNRTWGEGGAWFYIFETLKAFTNELVRKVEEKFEKIGEAIEGAQVFVDNIKTAFENFYNWLAGTVFTFNFDFPDLPDWGTPGSPIPLHTAWQDFGRFLHNETFAPQMDFTGAVMPAMNAGVFGAEQYNTFDQRQVQIGPNQVADGLDMAQVISLIRQELRSQMT